MTKSVMVKNVQIGGGAPISIQSMTDTLTSNFDATLARIFELNEVGCDLVRVSVPDESSVKSLNRLVKESPIPIIADIHYDYRLALKSLEAGVHKLRVNPGNLKKEGIKEVAKLASALMT